MKELWRERGKKETGIYGGRKYDRALEGEG